VGFTFVTCSIAALSGIDEREAGVASGLSNTTFQIGAAIGTAIVSTVAVARTNDVIAPDGGNRLLALVEGHQQGFAACAVLAGIGILTALLLLVRPPVPEPQPHPPEKVTEPATD
jgi:sugar phosphate permease